MKRILFYGSLILILGGMFALRIAGTWLLDSPEGVRWLFSELSLRTTVKIHARTVSGGMRQTLRMEGVTIRWPLGEATVEKLRLRSTPLRLPLGQLDIEELSLSGVSIRDNRPDNGKPPELTWPLLAGAPAWLNARIHRLQVENLEYRQRGEVPVTISGVSAGVEWRHAVLTTSALELALPAGRATGVITAGFGRPALAADITVIPASPAGDFSRFQLRATLHPSASSRLLAGPLSLTAFRGPRKGAELTGDIATTASTVKLTGLNLTRPGVRGTIRGSGEIILTATKPRGELTLRTSDLDLGKEIGTTTNLSGELTLQGSSTGYTGRFQLNNQGETWRSARLTGQFSGDGAGMNLTGVEGLILGGEVRGNLQTRWAEGIRLSGSLRGEKLDPARITPSWNGEVNLELQGSALWPETGSLRADLSGRTRASRLRGKTLSGEITAQLRDNSCRIERLLLVGNGFDIHAAGDLRQRLNLSAKITDLSGVAPGMAGALELTGGVSHDSGRTAGSLTGHGRELRVDGIRINSAELAARFDTTPGLPLEFTARMKGVTCNRLHVESAVLALRGSPERHTLELALESAGAEIRAAAAGGYSQSTWRGEITALSGRDRIGPWKLAAPTRVSISPEKVTLTPLRLTGIGMGELELAGGLCFTPLRGEIRADWSALNLSRGEQWLADTRLSGTTSGTLRLESLTGEGVKLTTRISAAGTATMADRTVTVRQGSLELRGDGSGIRSSLDFTTAEGIGLHGRFTSPNPARLRIPPQGLLNVTWEGVDLALFRQHLSPKVALSGTVSGKVSGRLLPHEVLDLSGTATLNNGVALWHSGKRELSAKIGKGDLSWRWQGETVSGAAALTLARHGKVTANVTLPLPARLPTRLDRDAPLRGELKGEFHENGLLAALFPGTLRESRGEVAVDLLAEGSWQEPRLTGKLQLSRGGADLPTAGITLKDLQLALSLERDQITVERFTTSSGGGTAGGNAVVRLAGYKVKGYTGSIKGEKFQILRLPQLQAVVTPDITFEGSPEKLTIRGIVKIPELRANDSGQTTPLNPSSDVIVDRGEEGGTASRQSRLALDIRLRTELGDRVFIKESGLDAQLEGGVELTLRDGERTKGTGEIRVTKGRFSSYGVTLEVKRGKALFAGGGVEQPALDILALREIGDVKAGVTVRGTPTAPVVRLYSDPAMPDLDILSLVVLGRKLGDSEGSSDLLMKATSFLASRGESVYLQEQIKSRLGIDTFEVTTAKQQNSTYTKIEPSLLGTGPKSSTGGIAESVLQVGKYLTPQLYFSYGWSPFNASHLFKIRYNITKQWEIESSTSTEASGGDIFYRIEFD